MAEDGEALTIDELARRTGMTVRNLRAHQSRGLLPPPEVRGRTGYYGADHAARVELIRQMQADGFSLELIRRLLDAAEGQTESALRFTRILREPFADEEPIVVSADELAERFGGNRDPKVTARAAELGVLRPLGDGTFELLSPRLARAGQELTRHGIPIERALEVVARLRRNADASAQTFVRLFIDEIWKPFEREGAPDERWPAVGEALEALRPLASDAVLAVFGMAMDDAVEEAFGRELKRLRRDAKRKR